MSVSALNESEFELWENWDQVNDNQSEDWNGRQVILCSYTSKRKKELKSLENEKPSKD